MKLYLDANVLIGAGRHPEHHKLKELATRGSVQLYWSPTVQHEHGARLLEKLKSLLPSSPEAARDELEAREDLRFRMRNAERDWWRPAVLNFAHCTFEGVIASPFFFVPSDPTGEVALLTDLLDTHGVKPKDAFHLMIAHSAHMDRVMTWDRALVGKASRVTWLTPKVETPADFLSSLHAP